MKKRSAGILMYKRSGQELHMLLVHPGGPFWAKKDLGAWSIPKGECAEGEEPLTAAKREFCEELGAEPSGQFWDLGALVQPSKKEIVAWAVEGDFPVAELKSNTFGLEWPPKSGRIKKFPEVDRAEWFIPADARRKILPGQVEFIDRLLARIGYAEGPQRPTQPGLMELVHAIVADDAPTALRLLAAQPALASARVEVGATRHAAKDYWLDEIGHYLYAGDTALHIAAAAYREEIVRKLIAMGADVRAKNRRGAEPLHYAVDGMPGSRRWNPRVQAAIVTHLIEAGADPNAVDKGGVTPLHRAVRNRCAAAVSALLEGGADAGCRNRSGSTPIRLATLNTGRGGTGSREAKAQQQEIVRLLEQHGSWR